MSNDNKQSPHLLPHPLEMTVHSLPPSDSTTMGADAALRYLRDRISVPRDMSIYAAKRLRTALEATATLAGEAQGSPIPFNHRRDQNPVNFAS